MTDSWAVQLFCDVSGVVGIADGHSGTLVPVCSYSHSRIQKERKSNVNKKKKGGRGTKRSPILREINNIS